MTLSDLSIRRPVLAAVANLLIMLFGLAMLVDLPVRELPDVDTSIITVTTSYTGAAPEVIDTDITEQIEGAVAAIAGIRTISSESRQGRSRTVIEFISGRDIDEAANDVRSAVARVRAKLPDEADEPQIVKTDADADPIMRLAVTSDRASPAEITDYVERHVVDRLATMDGVSSVDIWGQRPFAVRIWIDRRALAARNLTVADIESALRRSNIELPSGDVKSLNRQLSVRINSRLTSVEQFRNITIENIDGYPLRLGDVARVEAGVSDESAIVRNNGEAAVGLAVMRQSQANTVAISDAVRAEVDRISETLPAGMKIEVSSDDALFIAASIREVLIALFISLGLVVGVILLFLRSFRATLIPAVTIPVALIGCFLLVGLFGFSLNTLTLLALLLAIGLVVDDAIVVLENIQRRIEAGESPLVASVLGARQVTFAVLATSMTLIAVFVPLSFLPGQIGRLFVEFGWVMASTVAISTFVALSACPALASKILRPARRAVADTPRREGLLLRLYRALLIRAIGAPLVAIAVTLAVTLAAFPLYDRLPQELTPPEDRGAAFIPLTAPQGSTLEHTDEAARQVERVLQPLLDSGELRSVFTWTGGWGRTSSSFVVLRLAPWEERDRNVADIVSEIAPQMADVTIARGYPVTPAGLGVRGSSTPVRIVISGADFEQVKEWAGEMLEAAKANPGLANPELDFDQNLPQLEIGIDRQRAEDLGISAEAIAATLQTMFASREVTRFVREGREYPVLLQAADEDRRTPSDIANIFVRAGDDTTLVPLGSLVRMEENAAAPSLRRFDRQPSIQLGAALAPGYDLGRALTYLEDAAAERLPPEATIGFDGPSRTFKDTSAGAGLVFMLALVIVFLVLAAQFESFIHPLVIMLMVPTGIAGALYAMWLGGLSLNIYSQIGVILLIGLMSKNGILIVEFANQLRDEGYSVREAVIEASVLRLRPIVMTVIATIFGALPLVLASGAGAESRVAIGTVIIAGLAMSSVLMLIITPVLYDLMARFTKPRGAIEQALERELGTGPTSSTPAE